MPLPPRAFPRRGAAAASLLLLAGAVGVRAVPATGAARPAFVVRSVGDGGDAHSGDGTCRDSGGRCTLRAAIEEADASAGSDRIQFHIGSGGPWSIRPASPLPAITDPVVLDGTSQPGYGSEPLVTLNGGKLATSIGLEVRLANPGPTVITGLAVSGFPGAGIYVSGPIGGVSVSGCRVGTDRTGLQDRGNGGPGVAVDGTPQTVIGGTSDLARNVISGNGGPGILLFGDAVGTRVLGNYVGTDSAGSSALGNDLEGIAIQHAVGSSIGGSSPGEGNLVSGNGWGNGRAGIGLYFSDTHDNVVQGNRIGTDATGTVAIPNRAQGVAVTAGANHNVIGGSAVGAGNVISGNAANGVGFRDPGTVHNVVSGNLIGVDASGMRPLGNKLSGVLVELGASHELIGGTEAGAGNVIGDNGVRGVAVYHDGSVGNAIEGNFIGTDLSGRLHLGNVGGGVYLQSSGNRVGGGAAARNVIAYNRMDQYPFGAAIDIGAGSGNTLLGNSIHDNAGLGIDLGSNGVTANDSRDGDGGPNAGLNTPLVKEARGRIVRGAVVSLPSMTFRIEIYASRACDPSSHGEGATLVGRTKVATDGLGQATFSMTLSKAIASGKGVAATATDSAGDTSEFSPCVVSAQG